MSLPTSIEQREFKKFEIDLDGEVAVRTSNVAAYLDPNDSEYKIRTSAEGTLTPTGLKLGGKISEVALTATGWTPLPPTTLANRRQINVQNFSGIDVILNYVDTVSVAIGIYLPSGGERQYLLENNVTIYAKAASGTPNIIIEEIA